MATDSLQFPTDDGYQWASLCSNQIFQTEMVLSLNTPQYTATVQHLCKSCYHISSTVGPLHKQLPGLVITLVLGYLQAQFKARFLSLLGVSSANHRTSYFSNLACDWLSIVWDYSKQETKQALVTSLSWVWLLIHASISELNHSNKGALEEDVTIGINFLCIYIFWDDIVNPDFHWLSAYLTPVNCIFQINCD